MIWVYNIAVIVLLCWVIALAYQEKKFSAIIVLSAVLICGVFGQNGHISEVSGSLSQFTIKMQKVSDVLQQLNRLAVLMANSIIQIEDNAGSIVSENSSDKDRIQSDVVFLLKNLGVDQTDVTALEERIRTSDAREYVRHIIGYVDAILLKRNNRDEENAFEAEKEAMGKTKIDSIADMLKAIYLKYHIDDLFALRMLNDYTVFMATGSHTDLPFWRSRDTWSGKLSIIVMPARL